MPDSPASRRCQTASMAWPIGVIQPIPVMTTRFMIQSHFSNCCRVFASDQYAKKHNRTDDETNEHLG